MANKVIFAVLCFILLCASCKNSDAKIEKRKIGNYFIEASFARDSSIDGLAKIYDDQGKLKSIENYSNGKKSGYAISYYPNGKISDSTWYGDGYINGYEYIYDSLSNLSSISYHYYDILMGPSTFFINNKPLKYRYTSFDRNDLIDCTYDSIGNLTVLKQYTTMPRISEVEYNNQPYLDLFFYMPQPPSSIIEHYLGLTNDKGADKYLCPIKRDFIFKDTLLPYPEKGWYYFISTHFKNATGSVNKIFIEVIKK